MNELPIAFLILAHADANMLERLVTRIYDTESIYVIHINKRTDLAPFQSALGHFSNVHFVPDQFRVVVNWGGFSFTEAVFASIHHALRVQPHAQRFVLTSGADYPIKATASLLQEVRKDQEILTISRKLSMDGSEDFDLRGKKFFVGNLPLFSARTAPLPLRKLSDIIYRYGPSRRPYPLPLYHGPSWWSLTRPAIDYLIGLWGTKATEWFRYALLPDEMMIPTLLMSSSRRNFIKYNQLLGIGALDYEKGISGPTYSDWRNPNPNLPRHLIEGDFDDVIGSEALFIRKVDSIRSKPLLDRIDAYLTGVGHGSIHQG